MTADVGSLLSYNRYILTGLGDRTLVFPDVAVSEVAIINRNQVLALPFYDAAVLGTIHHHGRVTPILLLRAALGERGMLVPETLTVVCLTNVVPSLGGTGLVVDGIIGSLSNEQYQQAIAADTQETAHVRIEALASQIPRQLWQPQRWQNYPQDSETASMPI